MNKKRLKYFVDSCGLFTHGAIIFMALAAVFTLFGSLGKISDRYFMLTGLALPLACELLFLVLIVLIGRHTMVLTALPTVLFAVYFIIRIFTLGRIVYMIIFMALYLAIAVFYTATVFGWIRNKWLVSAIIFVTLSFNVAVIDYPALSKATVTVTFTTLMQEIAIIFMLLGLLFASLALKNKRPLEEANLPKMRSHKVVVNKVKPNENKALDGSNAENQSAQLTENETKELTENGDASLTVSSESKKEDTDSTSQVSTDK